MSNNYFFISMFKIVTSAKWKQYFDHLSINLLNPPWHCHFENNAIIAYELIPQSQKCLNESGYYKMIEILL